MSHDDSQIHKHKYRFLLVSCLSAFMGTLDGSIVNVSLPTLTRTFGVPIDAVAWIVLAYSLSISATLLMVGRIAVRKGFRYTYMMGFGLFAIGSLLCGLSESFWQLIASRVVHGIGASFMMAAGPALITRAFRPDERGKGMGIMGTIVGIGLMSGPPLGGLIVSTIGWQWIFLLNIPVSVFGYIYASKILKAMKPEAPDSKLNYGSGFMQAITVIFVLMFFNRVNSPDWNQWALYGMLAVGLIMLGLFLRRETTNDHPLIGLKIFKYREFTIAISTMLVSFMCTAAGMVLIPFYLEGLLKLQPHEVGVVLITIPIVMIVVAPLAGRISDRIGYRLLTTLGLAIMSAGIFWTSTLDQYSTRTDLVLRLIVMGIGSGMFQVPNSSVMMAAVPRTLTPIASGLLAVARTLGLAGGVAVATAMFVYRKNIYDRTLGADDAFVGAFSWVVVVFGIVNMVAMVISVFRRNRLPEVEAK